LDIPIFHAKNVEIVKKNQITMLSDFWRTLLNI